MSVDTLIAKTTTDKDTVDYGISSYPDDSSFTTKILTVGTFHGDEVWDSADKEKWFGLFQNMKGFYIAETKLNTNRVADGIVDENENDTTDWEVQTVNNDTSLILIEGLNYLTHHYVQQADLSKEQIFPGDTLPINYLGIDYIIFAIGEKKKIQENLELYKVWNYKLYVAAKINGQQHINLLAQPNFDDQMIKSIFAGDIDGNEILDLIMDTSRHYNVSSPTVYLSRLSRNSEVVKPIGLHTRVGC